MVAEEVKVGEKSLGREQHEAGEEHHEIAQGDDRVGSDGSIGIDIGLSHGKGLEGET